MQRLFIKRDTVIYRNFNRFFPNCSLVNDKPRDDITLNKEFPSINSLNRVYELPSWLAAKEFLNSLVPEELADTFALPPHYNVTYGDLLKEWLPRQLREEADQEEDMALPGLSFRQNLPRDIEIIYEVLHKKEQLLRLDSHEITILEKSPSILGEVAEFFLAWERYGAGYYTQLKETHDPTIHHALYESLEAATEELILMSHLQTGLQIIAGILAAERLVGKIPGEAGFVTESDYENLLVLGAA